MDVDAATTFYCIEYDRTFSKVGMEGHNGKHRHSNHPCGRCLNRMKTAAELALHQREGHWKKLPRAFYTKKGLPFPSDASASSSAAAAD